MKKISIAVLALVFANGVFSQEGETKNFRFGLKVAPSVNWMKPDNAKIFENGGSSIGFNWGLVTEFALSDLFSVSTGLELNYEGGKINFTEQAFYGITPSYEFIETKKDESTGNYSPDGLTTEDAIVELRKRKYSNTYVTLPVAIKMKTKEIGYMTYFGEFGVNIAFRTNTKVDDEGNVSALNTADFNDLNEINYDNDMQPLRAQLKVGFGAEYKIAGSTAIFGALHYNLGFTNSLKKESKYLINNNAEVVNQNFAANGIRLTIGVLF